MTLSFMVRVSTVVMTISKVRIKSFRFYHIYFWL
jgi:hypothetical protein